MTHFNDDVRYGIRLLLQSKGFTVAALLALALGIGANTAVFSVVDTTLIRPLPYPDSSRLVMVWEDVSAVGFPRNTPAPANWVDWRKRNQAFEDIAGTRGAAYNVTGDGPPEQIFGRRVTASFWTIMGTQPVVGRVFNPAEDQGDAPVAIISHGLWQRRFGGDPQAIGRKMILSGRGFEVIGVMPGGFTFPSRRTEIWTPAAFKAEELARRGSHYMMCVGRLKQGVSLKQAQAEMAGIANQLKREHPDENQNVGVTLVPLRDQVLGDTRTALLALLAAAGCVLLIACANIANLLLARGLQRQRELALRAALGAGRGRLIAQLVTESLLLAGLGALAGLGVARLGMLTLEKLVPAGMAATHLTLEPRVLAFSLALCFVTGLLFGVAPAFASTWLNANDVLKQGGRGSAGVRRHGLRDALVAGQVALALVLLAGAGLMIQTLYRFSQVDPGFRTTHLLTATTFLPESGFPKHAQREAFVNHVLEKVRAIPGVLSAGYTSDLPLITLGNTSGYILEGQSEKETATQDAQFRVVSTGYFETLAARLREGRFPEDTDRESSQPVVLVNETLANRHWQGQSAVGRRLQISNRGPDKPWSVIVGVIREIRERGIDIATKPAVYMPLAQGARAWPAPSALVIRTSVEPTLIVPALRQAVWSVDKDMPVSNIRTMEEVASLEVAGRRQTMILLASLALLSVVLAFIGIYGVLSYSVAQRSREIGLRVALGARTAAVLAMIAWHGLKLAAAGAVIGLMATSLATRWIASLLFGIKPDDPLTLAGVTLMLLAVSALACLVPAWRATKVDPAVALREE